MNPEIKQKWLDALRSGEYKKGKGVLKDISENKPSYCCLGVLCDIHLKETNKGEWIQEPLSSKHEIYKTGEDSSAVYLPNSVMKWAGLGDIYGSFWGNNGNGNELIHVNDHTGTFNEVIAAIEKYF